MKPLRRAVAVALLVAACEATGAEPPQRLDARYRDTANRILAAALTEDGAWEKLSYLCDRVGHRLSGSPELERAIAWAAEQMRADGLENVRLQPVKVPRWIRGRESVEVLEPVRRSLAVLGLGLSVGTPPEGITAPVVVVRSYDELEALGRDKVAGKIVLYDVPWQGYGRTVAYRESGPSRAARLGAVAVLLRSVASYSLYTPHTGLTTYAEDAPKIPGAALTVEDAAWLGRLARAGVEVKVKLQMEAQRLPDADSANVIGEIVGGEKPEEIVVLGGHIDSWDVGQGAHDDGAGSVAAMQALATLKRLGLRPRRTIRLVLWTAEETGVQGGAAYHKAFVEDGTRANHVAGIEADSGGERPVGFGLGLPALRGKPEEAEVKQRALERLRQIGALLGSIEAGDIRDGGGGADLGRLMRDGMPGLGLRTVGERYFHWHHTSADTLDKVEPENLRRQVAAMAVLAYVLADMPERLVEKNWDPR
ncbi:MAG TPA: M20/M25/M40 family metallo-hydrolase [Candidatus Xenobia bacterium]|nr:M20/M25/M40 family metallo-hydrolase [Candidatus Xenobia bacterium]